MNLDEATDLLISGAVASAYDDVRTARVRSPLITFSVRFSMVGLTPAVAAPFRCRPH